MKILPYFLEIRILQTSSMIRVCVAFLLLEMNPLTVEANHQESNVFPSS